VGGRGGGKVGAQGGAQVGDQVGDQVRAQVGDQVWAQVRAQVGAQVGDQVWDQVWAQVRAQVGRAGFGSQDAGWLSFYAYFADVYGITDALKLAPLSRLAASAGWWWPFENYCIITDRPSDMKRDAENRLHNPDGPAILYRDGFAVYAWHGTRLPADWFTNRGGLTPQVALTWPNIEQRRAACEILGWGKILSELSAKTINSDADPEIGELVEVELPDVGRERFLRVRCGTGRDFALPVPPDMKTALQAQAWTWGHDEVSFIKPEVRT